MLVILRLGHRRSRDKRISTHCGLVARAFGSDGIVFCGERDEKLIESLLKVCERWGKNNFFVEYERDWKDYIKKWKGIKVHLTMYGIPIQDKIDEIRKKGKRKNILVIVGSEKVPIEVYNLADYNIAITNQPHSEVAAIAIFLHEYFEGKELEKKFSKAKFRIVPKERGKKVVKN